MHRGQRLDSCTMMPLAALTSSRGRPQMDCAQALGQCVCVSVSFLTYFSTYVLETGLAEVG